MKKFLAVVLALLLSLAAFSGCTYTPPADPIIPDEEPGDEYVPDESEEQEFDNALDAFLFGEKYFKEDAAFYETVQYGTATAMGIGTYVMTKRYKSDVTNNFLYETSTIGTVIMGIDPTFTLKTYKEHGKDTIYYARVNGTDVPNGAFIDPQYSSSGFKAGTSVFDAVEVQTKENWSVYKSEVSGGIHDKLSVYKIDETTIKEVLSFEKDKGGFKYVFKLSLTEAAIDDYKNQVKLFSGQTYFKFNPLDLKDGLTLEFSMDKYGRILKLEVEENYTVDTGSAKAAVVNKSIEYFSYNKRPQIEIIDESGNFTGPTITPAALPSGDEDKIEQYEISFDSQGGSNCGIIQAFYNTEVGQLPEPEMEGYVFSGWFTSPNGEGTRYNERTLFTQREDITLYAYWYYIDPEGLGTYALINGGAEYLVVKGDESASGDYSIPLEYKGKPVTKVGTDAYRTNTELTSLFVHNKITSIEAGAFYRCTNITQIEFEEDSTLKHIGDEAFRELTKLEGISLPPSLESIGVGAFRGCSNASFDKIYVPKNVSKLGSSAFYGCSSVKEIVFEQGSKLTELEDELFRGCSNNNLASISIPEGIVDIGKGVFYGTKIKTVNFLGGNVTRIGPEAFYSCSNLTSIEIPSSVVLIDVTAFGYSGLTEVIFDGGSLETIGDEAFTNTKLVSVRIPSSVVKIGNTAFANMPMTFKSVSFAAGSKLEHIGNRAFYGNYNIESVSIPASVKTIGNEAFSRSGTAATNLASVEFGYGSVLEEIGDKAFERCASLTKIDIPSTVKRIGDNAFAGCTQLESIVLDENGSLESIGIMAFSNCSNDNLTEFVVPSNVKSIGSGAFVGTKITSLTLLTDAFVLKDGVLYSADYSSVVLSLPSLVTSESTLDDRVTTIMDYAFYTCVNLSIEALPPLVTSIGAYAFYGCTSITKMDLSASITNIGSHAFYGCTELEEINIPSGITEIPESMFYNCAKLDSINIHKNITSIGNNSFRGTGLTDVQIPSSVTSIGSNAFMNCKDLESISLNEGLETLGNAAFSGCTALLSVEIPSTVKQIGNVFTGCTSLNNVVLNEGLETINMNAFQNCKALERIELPSSLKTLANAFSGCNNLKGVVVNRYIQNDDNPITSMTSNAFSSAHADLKIYVPSGALTLYGEANNWKTHIAKIEAKA